VKRKLDELLLATGDAGSLPLQDDFDESRRNVDQAIVDKVSVGLDYPCYPQLAGSPVKPVNMALQFLIPLSKTNPEIQIRGQEVHLLSDEIKDTSAMVGVDRAEYFLTFLREHELTHRLRGVKACVTGPFTLAGYLGMKNVMTCGASKPNIVEALAKILSRTCRRFSDLGFDIVNIDEPFLSIMLGRKHELLYKYDEQFVIEMLNSLIREMTCLTGIHVCGNVTPLVKDVLLASEADIIDHEFTGSPRNLHAYSRDDLEQAGKFLAFGCVSSVRSRVETVEEITASLKNALNLYGPRVIVKPDCGFAGMQGIPDAYPIVLRKLENMVDASRNLDVRKVSSVSR